MRASALILAAMAALLGGCASTDDQAIDRIAGRFSADDAPDPAMVARLTALMEAGAPVVALSLSERDQVAGLVQVTRNGDWTTWLAIDNSAITLDRGIVVATRGLGWDLMSADIAQTRALVLGRRDGVARRFHSYLNGEYDVVVRSFVCDVENAGPRQLNVMGRDTATVMMRESCHGVDDTFLNLYWVDPASGEAVQSTQWGGPNIGRMTLRRIAQ